MYNIIMNDFLTLPKILKDSVALYRVHFLYITALISVVIVPYTLLIRVENLPDGIVFIIPVFILLMMLVEIVSTILVSSGYVDIDFNITEQLNSGLKIVLPYTLITLLAIGSTFLGLSFFILPGIIVTIFFNILKVDFIINKGTIRDRFKSSIELLKEGSFFKIVKIYMLPMLLQLLMAFVISPFMKPETLEQDIERIYPYMSLGIIVVFPISICFRTAIYYNNIKNKQLKTTNELV